MKELFNRTAELLVGQSLALGKRYVGFRIAFDVDKTSESTPSAARIALYNLSKQTRGELEAGGLTMALSAGYAGIGQGSPVVSQIFVGNITWVSTERQGPDLVTTLEAGDGETAIRTARIDQAFPPFTGLPQVLQTLGTKLGVAIGTIAPGVAQVFEHGLSLTGLVSDNLDTLTKTAGLDWHVNDGTLNILPQGGSTTEPPILLSPQTGLIGAVGKRKYGKEQGKLSNHEFGGYEFSSLIRPGINPGRRVYLQSDTFSGVVTVTRARFRGDTHGADWRVDVEAS